MGEQYADFKNLLKAGIGDRQQAEFADLAGVSREWVSRTLNSEHVRRPMKSTLEKIAPFMDGGITLGMLLTSCGYDALQPGSAAAERAKLSDTDRILKNADDIEEGLMSTIGMRQFWETDREFFNHMFMLHSVENLSYQIKEIRNNTNGRYASAEKSMLVKFIWEDNKMLCSTYAVLYYLKTEHEKKFFFGHSLNPRDITEAGFDLPPNAVSMTSEKGVPFVSFFERKHSYYLKEASEEFIRTALNDDVYYSTTCGFGLQFENKIDPETFRNFMSSPKHKATFCCSPANRLFYDNILSSENPLEAAAGYKNCKDGLSGCLAMIAHVMQKETNIDFIYCIGDAILGKNYSFILVEEKNIHIQDEYLVSITQEYAKELGLSTVGYYYHTVLKEKEHKEIYPVKK